MRFASRMGALEDKELLNLMELAETEDTISFSGGFPSPETYPLEDITKAFAMTLARDGKEALSYGSSSGYKKLRQIIAARMEDKFQTKVSLEEVIITSGSQQALDMSAMLFVDKGDVVLFEMPTYLGALSAFKVHEASLAGVKTDEEGIDIQDFERAMKEHGNRVKAIYVIPDYQNPSGRCWSEKRRQDFMECASKYDIAVLEDAAYAELGFNGTRKKPLFYYDKIGQVVYCGTYSKTFCPGLRVAWICARKTVMGELLALKNSMDLSSSAIAQRQMVYYIENFDYDGHVGAICDLYQSRMEYMVKVMKETFPPEAKFGVPEGGLFLWVELPEKVDTREILRKALAQKVAFVPGGSFYPYAGKNNEMRLNFSNMSEPEILEGMTRLGRILHENI